MRQLYVSSAIAIGAISTFLFASRAPAASPADVAPVAPAGKTYACGDKGQPPCPMQKWMKENMAPAAANGGPHLTWMKQPNGSHKPLLPRGESRICPNCRRQGHRVAPAEKFPTT